MEAETDYRLPDLIDPDGEGQPVKAPGEVSEGGDLRITVAKLPPADRVKLKRKRAARRFFVETITYAAFLTIFCLITYTLRSTWTFYMSQSLIQTFVDSEYIIDKDLKGLQSVGELDTWMRTTFLPAMYPTVDYAGRPLPPERLKFTIDQSLRVGKARLRLLRAEQGSKCQVGPQFGHVVTNCWASDFSDAVSATQPYGPAAGEAPAQALPDVAPAFIHRTGGQLCEDQLGFCTGVLVGKKATSRYGGDGYVWDLSNDRANATAEWSALIANRWFDYGARALFIDFTLFNPNINLICAVKLVVEFWPTGELAFTVSIKPMPLMGLGTAVELVMFVGEVMLVVVVAIYLLGEIREFLGYLRVKQDGCPVCLKRTCIQNGSESNLPCVECGHLFNPFRVQLCPECTMQVHSSHLCWRGYFQEAWNFLDLINQAFFMAVFGMRFILRFKMTSIDFAPFLAPETERHVMFYPIAYLYSVSNWLNSINALLCFMKTFKYLGKFRSLSALVRTLAKARGELVYFNIIFFVIYAGFALSFNLAFGMDIAEFATWPGSMQTLVRFLLGEFNYPILQKSNRILAPIFFVFYQLTVLFVLANMFIAIISSSFEQAKEDIQTGKLDYLSASLAHFLGNLRLSVSRWLPFIFKGRGKFEKLLKLLDSFAHQDSSNRRLTPKEKDELGLFRAEVEEEMDNEPKYLKILTDVCGPTLEFPKDDPVHPNRLDFKKLKDSVADYNELLELKDRQWEEEAEEGEMQMKNPGRRPTSAYSSATSPSRRGEPGNPRMQQISRLEGEVEALSALVLSLVNRVHEVDGSLP